MNRVSAIPDELASAARIRDEVDDQLARLAVRVDRVLEDFHAGAVEHGVCTTVDVLSLYRNAGDSRQLNAWTRAIATAFREADGVGDCDPAVVGGVAPTRLEQQDWDRGVQAADRVLRALDAGDQDRALEHLRAIGDLPPEALPGAFATLGDLEELDQRVTDAHRDQPAAWRFAVGAVTETVDLVVTVGELVQMTQFPLDHTDEWWDLARGLGWAVTNPLQAGSVMLDLEGLRRDPARWAGALVPNVVIAVGTMGSGAVASRVGRAAGTLKAARSAGDVMHGLRLLGREVAVLGRNTWVPTDPVGIGVATQRGTERAQDRRDERDVRDAAPAGAG